MHLRNENTKMMGKLAVITVCMFAFGYALIPLYKHICEITGINILSLVERQVPGNGVAGEEARSARNTQVDVSRTITVEFDANARGPWEFKPETRSVQVHPGELTTVMYEFGQVLCLLCSRVSITGHPSGRVSCTTKAAARSTSGGR